MPSVSVRGLPIHYELNGPEDAPVLVFSNSLGTDLSMWDTQRNLLSKEFRILCYDMRGQGQSSVLPGDTSIGELARDFLGLLDALGLKHVTFCGLSMGGMIGIWLGVNEPARLRRLVLCNTAARIGTTDMWNARIASVRRGGMKAISAAVLERWFSPQFCATSPATVERARAMLEASPVEGYVSCCTAIRDMDQTDSISHIRTRTLVITGEKDMATPAVEGRLLAERIPGAQCVQLDAAHLSNIERSEEFTSTIREFLTT